MGRNHSFSQKVFLASVGEKMGTLKGFEGMVEQEVEKQSFHAVQSSDVGQDPRFLDAGELKGNGGEFESG